MSGRKVGRYKPYLTWTEIPQVIHNHKNPCGKAPKEGTEVKKLVDIPYRPEFKKLCELCDWGDREIAEKQFRKNPEKREEE